MDLQHLLEFAALLKLGESRPGARNLVVRCPFARWRHLKSDGTTGRDHKPSFGITIDPNRNSVFNCFACGEKGDLLDLVGELAALRGVDESDWMEFVWKHEEAGTIERLADRAVGDGPKILTTPKAAVTKARITQQGVQKEEIAQDLPDAVYPESEYAMFLAAGPPAYATERGLEANTCRIWQIGNDEARGRMTFPVRDRKGRLVGIKGRSYRNDRDKYIPYLVFNQGDWLFGHHLAVQSPADQPVVVVEGEIDTMKVWQAGFTAVGLMGSKPTAAQKRALEFLDRPLVLFPDGDRAGIDCMKKLAQYLSEIQTVRWIEPIPERDPGALSRDQIVEAVDDAKLWV